jgi:hypothetical protein
MNQDMRNKSCECECRKVKDNNKRTKEAIPLKIEEVLKLWTLFHQVFFCEKCNPKFGEKQGSGEKFLH